MNENIGFLLSNGEPNYQGVFMTFDQMKQKYPNEHVEIGSPLLIDDSFLGGYVLLHSSNEDKIVSQFVSNKANYERFHNMFTSVRTTPKVNKMPIVLLRNIKS
jgi:hypothetical protein